MSINETRIPDGHFKAVLAGFDRIRQETIVGIEKNEKTSFAVAKSRVARSRESLVVLPNAMHVRVMTSNFGCIICRTIIHHYDFDTG